MLFFADSVLAQKSVVQTIVLDAGHGGKDSGAPELEDMPKQKSTLP